MAAATAGISTAKISTANSFLVMGHGLELQTEFEERPILPEGYTLVLMSECGIITSGATVIPFIEAFASTDTDIQAGLAAADPVTINKIQGGKTVHIIRAGQRYPRLIAQMFLDFKNEDTETKLIASKSGLYSAPIALSEWQLNPVANSSSGFIDKYTKPFAIKSSFTPSFTIKQTLKDDSFLELYSGSILPTHAIVRTQFAAAAKTVETLKKSLRFSLEDLFAAGGPGVYYWPVCRHMEDHLAIHEFAEEVDNAISEERGDEYRKYAAPKNWVAHSAELLALVNEDLASNPPPWFVPTLAKLKTQLETNAPLITRARAASHNASNVTEKRMGGGSRRRRMRPKRTQKRKAYRKRRV